MKLKLKLSLIVIAINVIAVVVIGAILLSWSARLQISDAHKIAESNARSSASELQRQMEVYMDTARACAQIMDNFESVQLSERRSRFNDILYGVLDSNTQFLGIYSAWFPNALDGMDARYANTEGSDASGRYAPFYLWEKGEIVFRTYTNYEEVLANTRKEHLTSPVFYDFGGTQVLVTHAIIPIIRDNVVYGIVGVIIDLGYIEGQVLSIQPYRGSKVAVYSTDGTIVAHYGKNRLGKNIRDTEKESNGVYNEPLIKKIANGESDAFEHYVPELKEVMYTVAAPMKVGNSDTPWSLVLSVQKDEIMKPVWDMLFLAIIISAGIAAIMVVIIIFVVRGIAKPIITVSEVLKDISEGEGDLTKSLTIHSKDEIGDLAHYFNLTLEKIRHLVVAIKDKAANLFDVGTELSANMTETAAAVNQIAANIQNIRAQVVNQSASVTETNSTMEQVVINIDKLNHHVENQSASVTQSSSAIEEMLANIASVTQTLVKNVKNVNNLAEASEVGRAGLQEVSSDIQEIARESEGLLEINAVMENIASQTNLLSMNAAIEAAHAGEAGKGFAVVADEIRKLAESSGEQSKTISDILKKIKGAIDKITVSTDEVLARFEVIDSGVKTVSEQEENIRNAMEEQGHGSKQILEAITQLNEITNMVKNGSEEMFHGSQEVIREGGNLARISEEIAHGMTEMAAGSDQINNAINDINGNTSDTKHHIEDLVSEVSKFKVD